MEEKCLELPVSARESLPAHCYSWAQEIAQTRSDCQQRARRRSAVRGPGLWAQGSASGALAAPAPSLVLSSQRLGFAARSGSPSLPFSIYCLLFVLSNLESVRVWSARGSDTLVGAALFIRSRGGSGAEQENGPPLSIFFNTPLSLIDS